MNSFFSKFCCNKSIIIYPLSQFTGLVKDVLQQCKGFFSENTVFFPGILCSIAVDDSNKLVIIGFCKLRLDDISDFCRSVAANVIKTFWMALVNAWMMSG